MSRFAPTLVVGLGGSGIGVLRYLKQRIVGQSLSEPIVYLGVDLDENSRIEGSGIDYLDKTEAHYFDAKPIENCIKNIHREVMTPQGPRYEFETIRKWFTASSDRDFRGAQVSAAGARQWRPLGRVGFSLHVRKIVETITAASSRLDRVRGGAVGVGDLPVIYLIASVAGGTGSGMLHDVAANLRKEMPDFPVMAFLILPEVFAMKPFTDNVFANTYGALQEVAHLKNQHIIFETEYPDYRPITATESIVLFQRVYLFGPWVGNLKPFAEPEDAYRYFADLLLLTLSRELRADTLSSQANASGDSGRSLSDPASKNVFSEIAATGIRLLSLERLAEQVLVSFATEVKAQSEHADEPRRILSLFANQLPPNASLEKWIKDRIDAAGELFSTVGLQATAGSAFDERTKNRRDWPESELRRLVRDMNEQFGFGSGDMPMNVVEATKDFENDVRGRLTAEMARHPLRASYVSEIESVLDRLPRDRRPAGVQAVSQLEALPGWYGKSRFRWMLATPTLPTQLPKARADIVAKIGAEADKYRQWARYQVLSVARREIEHTIANEAAEWQSTVRLCQRLLDDYPHLAFSGSNRGNSDRAPAVDQEIYLDCGSARPPDDILEEVLKRASRKELENFTSAFASALREHAQQERDPGSNSSTVVESWLGSVRQIFVSSLGALRAWYPRDANDEPRKPFRLLPPALFYEPNAVAEAVRKCTTPLFQEGRVPPSTGRTVVRVVVPSSFPGAEKAGADLVEICDGEFHAHASRVQRGVRAEDRIIIVVERLFRDAREIDHIDDYAQWYQQRGTPDLFHVDRRWLDEMAPIVSRSGRQGRVQCGNAGCSEDIRGLSGQTLFCPGCGHPIRNRCGNADCQMDDLASRPGHAEIVDSKLCPSCHLPLRTYWWRCEHHGDVAMDKISCPQCAYEGRAPHGTFWRPDHRERFICPHCVKTGRKNPFTSTGDVSRWLTYGVDGQEVLYAIRKFKELLPDGEHCSECGTRLVAYCPLGEINGAPHFLYRNPLHGRSAEYRCFAHVNVPFYTCSVCLFAVPEDAANCSRCQTVLRRCRFCSDAFRLLIPATDTEERCPNCRTYPDDAREFDARPTAKPDDLFCSNIYGCPIGAHLNEATLPADTRSCPLCANADLPLLSVQTRDDHLAACAFCTQLFGRIPTPGESWGEGTCCFCGMTSAIVREFVRDDQAMRAATMIANALRLNSEDAAFTDLYGNLLPTERPSIPDLLRSFRSRITRPAVLKVVLPRLERIHDQWRRQVGCRGSRRAPSSASPSSDKGTGQPFPPGVLDLNFLFSCEADPSRWIRFAKESGVRLEDLPGIQASLEAQIDENDLMTRHRVGKAVQDVAEQWDTVDEP